MTDIRERPPPPGDVENACFRHQRFQLAVQALRAGACDIALALGAEKMNIEDKMRALALFEGGWDVLTADENAARLLSLSRRDHTVVSWPSTLSLDILA